MEEAYVSVKESVFSGVILEKKLKGKCFRYKRVEIGKTLIRTDIRGTIGPFGPLCERLMCVLGSVN